VFKRRENFAIAAGLSMSDSVPIDNDRISLNAGSISDISIKNIVLDRDPMSMSSVDDMLGVEICS